MKKTILLIMLIFLAFNLFGQIQDTTIVADTTVVLPGALEDFNILTIISILLTILFSVLALVFGTKYYKKKQILIQLLQSITDAVKDNRVTKKELERIIQIYKSL